MSHNFESLADGKVDYRLLTGTLHQLAHMRSVLDRIEARIEQAHGVTSTMAKDGPNAENPTVNAEMLELLVALVEDYRDQGRDFEKDSWMWEYIDQAILRAKAALRN